MPDHGNCAISMHEKRCATTESDECISRVRHLRCMMMETVFPASIPATSLRDIGSNISVPSKTSLKPCGTGGRIFGGGRVCPGRRSDEGRVRQDIRTSTGASVPTSSRSHSSLILALTNSTVWPTANCGGMGRGGRPEVSEGQGAHGAASAVARLVGTPCQRPRL